ncbi:hypothetical protein HDU83_002751 [Entophlyctis luteolus]|nr:hypothetical protein HDU83_002751 [Entophlyctis luteolus]KAJ3393715.1 hypothetical protein HDU84_001122 [Entophlyctis sp. JEL0112]
MSTVSQRASMDSPQAGSDKERHTVALKVMRLSRPALSIAPVNESAAQGTSTQSVLLAENIGSFSVADALSPLLSLPPAFGTIFLGETFTAHVGIVNEGPLPVSRLAVKAELQTQSQRFVLVDSSTSTISLEPAAFAEYVISHDIKELGVHILVCSVSYADQKNAHKSFRKFYKFQVTNPLSVKTKVNSMIDGTVYLEAQVQNASGFPMFLEKLLFESSDLFDAVDMSLNYRDSVHHTGSVFAESAILNDKDSRQYLYSLTPKRSNDLLAKQTPTLGKLDIQWRTTMGQQGRLQTAQLSRKITPTEPVRVQVISAEQPIRVEQPFSLTCRLWNNSQTDDLESATVLFIKSKMGSVLVLGTNEKRLGTVSASGFVDFTVQFFPLLGGVQKITGMKVIDNSRAGTAGYDIDVLCEVEVGVE